MALLIGLSGREAHRVFVASRAVRASRQDILARNHHRRARGRPPRVWRFGGRFGAAVRRSLILRSQVNSGFTTR